MSLSSLRVRRYVAVYFASLALLSLLLCRSSALASDGGVQSCDGPPECCPSKVELADAGSHAVKLGVVLMGIYEVTEKTSSWTADFYLYESWQPAPGFVPQTEVVNELARKSIEFDTTELRDGQCARTRHVRSTLRTPFNLRTFPFDEQSLMMELSDAEFPTRQVHYEQQAIAGLDDAALRQVAAWKVMPGVHYQRSSRAFQWEQGAPDYDYATFSVAVRRHVSFHLGKYFLPLLLIVIVSFTVFWIDPSDLASEVQVAVTCLLAAVALQLSEGSALPEVSYLTIADRAFATSYVAIALAILQVVYTNYLARSGKQDRALKLDRLCRVAFPAGLVFVLALVVARAYAQSD